MDGNKIGIGIIGLGARSETLLATMFAMEERSPDFEVTAVCDVRDVRISRIQSIIVGHGWKAPAAYSDYRDLIADPRVDAVLVPASWNSHLEIAKDAMRAGKYAGIEVGGASSLTELWELVHASESTGVSCMMLENSCYERNELMVLNMVRKGLFGELIYCECGYEHDISEMAWNGTRLERALHNRMRNADLYPTHGIGPISKILRINRGNRFLSLTSTATKGRGFELAAKEHGIDCHYNAGDVVTTVIKCANGENITVKHCVSLPRPYSRSCRVQGTKGIWLENAKSIYIDGISPKYEKLDVAGNPYLVHDWEPETKFYAEYDHPLWKEYHDKAIGSHNGIDALVLSAFFDAVRNRTVPPIDVYDCAAWMAVTALSEQSVALGSAPVAFPDFTNGKWIAREPLFRNKWCLDEVCE